VAGDSVRPLTAAPYDGGQPDGSSLPLRGLDLLAPCQPSKIVCIGKNYYDHAIEMAAGVPDNPILFLKPSTSVAAPGAPITRPRTCQRLDYEGELAFVVGRTAYRVPAAEAAEYIFGYTICNDVTARDLQAVDGQWTRAKGFDGFAPIGPYLVTDIDPGNLQLTTRLGGQVKQSASTALMMFGVPALLEFITEVMTLLPGDVVSTGTPAGVGPMADGDEVSITVEGIGTLTNPVRWETP